MATYSAGSAAVEISPDFRNFVRELRNDLDRVEANLHVEINPDMTGFVQTLETELGRVSATLDVEIQPDAQSLADLQTTVQAYLDAMRLTATVQLGVDTTVAASEIEAFRAAAAERPIHLDVEANTRVAAAEMEAFRRAVSDDITIRVDADTSNAADRINALSGGGGGGGRGGLGRGGFVTGIANLGALGISQLPAAATGLAMVGADLQAIAQSAALLPALFAGGAAAAGTLIAGMQGFKDAFSDDPKKAALAMAELSASARDTVVTIKDYGDEWDRIQGRTQEALWSEVDNPLRQMIDAQLPGVEEGMVGLAGKMNEGIKIALGELGSEEATAGISRIFGNTQEAAGKLNAAVEPIISSVGRLASTGSSLLPGLADDFAGVTDRFDEWLKKADESGDLNRWIHEGVDALKDLGSIIGNIGSSLSSIFRAASGDGEGFLGTVDNITERWADWLGSDAGQSRMREFFLEGREQLDKWVPILQNIGGFLGSVYEASQTWASFLMPFLSTAASLLGENRTIVQSLLLAWLAYRTIGPVITGLIGQIAAFRAASAAAATGGAGALGRSAAGLGAVLGAGGILGLGLAGAAIGLGFLATKHAEAKSAADDQRRALEALGETLDKQSGKATEATVTQAAGMLERGGFLGRAETFGVNTQDYVRASLGIDPNAKGAINEQLTQVILDERGSAGTTWGRAAEVTGLSNETIAQALQGVPAAVTQYADALAQAQLEQKGGFLPTLTDLKNELNDTGESAATLGGEMNRVDSETAKLGEQVRRTNEAINGTYELTEEGRRGFEELGVAVTSVPDAKTVFVEALTEEQQRKVEDLGATVERLPDGSVRIDLSDEQARAQIAELVKPETKTITVQHIGIGENKTAQPITRDGYASGGRVTGGVPNQDSVPIMAMPDEVVFDHAAVNALGGPEAADRFRMALGAGLVRGYKDGGIVGWDQGDQIKLEQAENKVTQAQEKAQFARQSGKSLPSDIEKADLAVKEAEYDRDQLLSKKNGGTGPSTEILPQAELPGRMSDEAIGQEDAKARVDDANTERNRVHNNPNSTKEQRDAADRAYASAQNALEKQGAANGSGDDGGLPSEYTAQGIGARAGAIIGQGILSFLGLENSILSDSNVYNRAIGTTLDFYAEKNKQEDSPSGGGYAYQPKNLPVDKTAASPSQSSSTSDTSHSYDQGAGVEQWRPTFIGVLDSLRMPRSWVDLGLAQMTTESGGNPQAINNWDSNAAAGTPSKGLMQVIDPTFQSYRSDKYPNDIWNPGANIAAALQYLVARYEGPDGVWGQGHGYADGGWVEGLGGPRSDSVKARLSPKEFVMNAVSAEANAPWLEAMNAGLALPTAMPLPPGLTPRGGDVQHMTRDHSVRFEGPVQVMDVDHLMREQDRWTAVQSQGAMAAL